MPLPQLLRVILGGFLVGPPVCTAESQLRWPEQCSGKVLSPGEAFSWVLPRSWARPLRLSWEAKSLLQCLVVPLAWHEAGRVAFEGEVTFQSSSGSVGIADEKLLFFFFLAKGQPLGSPGITKIKLLFENSSSVPQHPRGLALINSVDPQEGLDSVKRLAQGHKADRRTEGSTQGWGVFHPTWDPPMGALTREGF